MTTKLKHTSAVWGSLIELVSSNKKRFLLVVFISLLSTVTSLVEPLIYREAINDVAGLFVHKAKVEAAHGNTVTNDDDPISSFFEKEVASIRKEPHRSDHVEPYTSLDRQ